MSLLNYEINKEVLKNQWAILVRYDKTATNLKKRSIARREFVVGIIAIASIASIMTGIQMGIQGMAYFFVGLAIVLPAVAEGILRETTTFHGSTDWIKFRFIAETIRMHIYQYRTGSGAFTTANTKNADNKLTECVEQALNFIEEIPNLDLLEKIEESEVDEAIKTANSSAENESGFDPITFDDYLKWRVKEQRTWYQRAIQRDRRKDNNLTRIEIIINGLVVSLAGIIGLAIDPRLVVIVAVINVFALALKSWRDVNHIGTTRSIFVTTENMLGQSTNRYAARKNDDDCVEDPIKCQREFINEVEALLDWERREWYKIILAAQIEAAEKVYEEVAKLAQQHNADNSDNNANNGNNSNGGQ